MEATDGGTGLRGQWWVAGPGAREGVRWAVLGLSLVVAVAGWGLEVYAQETHRQLVWGLCRPNDPLPARVRVAAVAAPLLSLSASAVAGLIAAWARRRPVLLVAAAVVAVVLGLLGALEAYATVDLLVGDHDNGNGCAL
ncbi:hypothetical protein [Kitasatospora sp. NPDC059327]|uniref:hypothetical protein n=1 Tax=Kitasatospora sp. NPDC059327 TaxID=3346803 RepID=UPI00367A1785